MLRRDESLPLHGLRGIAVLYVVFSHLGNSGMYLLPIDHGSVGKLGVWIFFALSAYLLTGRLYLAMRQNLLTPLAPYFVHRVFRVFPLFAVVIAIHVAIGDFSLREGIRHLYLMAGWGELWAIPVEFRYYLVIPLVCVLFIRLPAWLAYLVMGIGAFGSYLYGVIQPGSVTASEVMLTPKLLPFVFGSAFSIWISKRPGYCPPATATVGFAGALGLAGTTILLKHYIAIDQIDAAMPALSLLLSISAVALIYGCLGKRGIASVLAWRPLILIGKVSFSLYLLHMFVIRLAASYGIEPSAWSGWAILCVAIALAALTYCAIERPGISLGRAIGKVPINPAAHRSPSTDPNN